MAERSFFYQGAEMYKLGLRLIHWNNLSKRYEYISGKIGQNKTILEPACGPALLPKFLDKSNNYKGFDINEKFIWHAQKKGINVCIGNALDISSYQQSDVVVLCDALHHIGLGNEKKVLENCLNSAKEMVIICEPFKDYYLKLLPSWFPKGQTILRKWYDYIEKDGNNQVRLENVRTRKELEESMLEGFGVIPKGVKRNIKNIGEDLIITYYL